MTDPESPQLFSSRPIGNRARQIMGAVIGTLAFLVIAGVALRAKMALSMAALAPGVIVVMLISIRSPQIFGDPTWGQLLVMCTIFGISALPTALIGALLASVKRDKRRDAVIFLALYLVYLLFGSLLVFAFQGSAFDT